MIIFFIGFMGSGKTYQARRLSGKLGIPFYDLDQYIENKEGITILSIFETRGELTFRELEKKALRELVGQIQRSETRSAAIACGGGTPCFHQNMEFMNNMGVTVWLNPPVETLVKRLMNEKQHRPLLLSLNADDLPAYISKKIMERQPFYNKAQITIEDPDIEPELLINQIQHAKKLS